MTDDRRPDYLDEAMSDLLPMDPTEALRRLQTLAQTQPNLEARQVDGSATKETLQWLG